LPWDQSFGKKGDNLMPLGEYDSSSDKIKIKAGLTKKEKKVVLKHELGHRVIQKDKKPMKEARHAAYDLKESVKNDALRLMRPKYRMAEVIDGLLPITIKHRGEKTVILINPTSTVIILILLILLGVLIWGL
jgi:hypothetical protein